ncbi:hypothetical protein KIW84_050172 [Lathyrus oleraceus]|uniref:NmrA-like domain-containing protein n=1 Tax=Pisum sativum TaxID=3888 RepID=A0A9D4WIF9_PEA|nr:hypothetical protein KIW84_050172 [Pisum sativum]
MAGSNLSKILLIGGTGYIGKFIAEASVKAGHPAFVLTRESTLTNPAKSSIINKFKDLSVNLVILRTKMDLYDHQSLVKAIKQVDVVISTVARSHLADQDKIISAIKVAGNVKFVAIAPPRDKVVILGDGNPKAVFNKEEDIAAYTIKAVDDPRYVSATVYCLRHVLA